MRCPNLIVAVDHAPLVKLLGNWSLNDIPNPRLLCLKNLPVRYSIKHVPRIANKGPDSLSRHSVILAEDAGDLEAMPLYATLTHSLDYINSFNAIVWERQSKRHYLLRPHPSAEDLDSTYIYLPAFLPTSGSYPVRFNPIGMSATICPVLVKHWWLLFPGSRPLTPCAMRPFCPPGHHQYQSWHTQTCVYWPSMSTSIINCSECL